MALRRGCHVIAKGDVAEATRIAPEIEKRGLLVSYSRAVSLGIGAWAYPVDQVPDYNQEKPMVVFEVEDHYVEERPINFDGRWVSILKLRGNLNLFDYVPIQVLGFLNLPPPFPVYEGPIGFYTC